MICQKKNYIILINIYQNFDWNDYYMIISKFICIFWWDEILKHKFKYERKIKKNSIAILLNPKEAS